MEMIAVQFVILWFLGVLTLQVLCQDLGAINCSPIQPCVCEHSQRYQDFKIKCSEKSLTQVPDFSLLQWNESFPVQMIDLSNNDITEIKADAFKGLTPSPRSYGNLITVKLDDNKISKISKSSFNVFLSVDDLHLRLSLENNNLTNLSFMPDVCRASRTSILAAGNPFHCDCAFFKTVNTIVSNPENISRADIHGSCDTPSAMKGHSISSWYPGQSEGFEPEVTFYAKLLWKECADEVYKYGCNCQALLPHNTLVKEEAICARDGPKKKDTGINTSGASSLTLHIVCIAIGLLFCSSVGYL